MKIYIGCDHAAFEEKEILKKFLTDLGHQIDDVGTHENSRCDYPDYASALAKGVVRDGVKGILLCGSGIGVSMVANRYKGARAALCRTEKDAILSIEHNNANILCVGARINTMDEIKSITKAWLGAEFQEGRHTDRVAMFNDIGEDV
ncbi:ribose 5-phosphate isomerase [Halobacteriovorax marinus SJ]|uniref:Ribose 5-phosphate isomerase n=1 Tax=Halobacteriovorax marinus (strain ATCC BAA-682 / DSM 15412 / SJ) TaxID=862908 RepID=E1WZA7_HALMS|nr:ribose 5-phosphate isomerase B [Halobacteriovorax marinus]CBW27795.1 ribose 5-phosphate isomerase [Halobacteriovorax marinus SJ]